MIKKHQNLSELIFFLLIIIWGIQVQAQSDTTGVYYKKFVVHADGSYCEHVPPEATFTTYLNGDISTILIENAPTWQQRDPNITKQGTVGLQLGDFPSFKKGDEINIRYTDNPVGQQGIISDTIKTIPWSDPNPFKKLVLAPADYPSPPDSVTVKRDSLKNVISWKPESGCVYYLYRTNTKDTLTNGKARNLYHLIGDSLVVTQFTDSASSKSPNSDYIVYARNQSGKFSSHSTIQTSMEYKLLSNIPKPIIPSRPDLLSMYDKCWLLGNKNSHHGTVQNGFVPWYVDEAFDNRIFQYDSCVMMAWAKYSQGAMPNIQTLDNFYRKQHADGAISGVIRESDGTDDQPESSPWFTRNDMFAWAEYHHYEQTGDSSRFSRVIPVIDRYDTWIRNNRRHANGHFYWSGWSSGMDNSPRSVADQFYPPYSWVDYDANEALSAYYLVKMAKVTGDSTIAKKYRTIYSNIKNLVNNQMWSDKDDFYWDLDRDGSFMKVRTVASFWPMIAHITNTKELTGLIGQLNNPQTFNRPHRVPTLAADQADYSPTGDYWRGGVWAPTDYMIIRGLVVNNKPELAREIAVNHLNNMAKVFEKTGTVWENYAPESALQGQPAKADFVGWSGVGPIAELIENYIGINLDVPNKVIKWNLLTTMKVGVQNLQFGNGMIKEIYVDARSSLDAPVTLHVNTNVTFTLKLYDGNKVQNIDVKPTDSTILLSVNNREKVNKPDKVTLKQNYPNPFNPSTNIEFTLPTKSIVFLTVYNILGQKVATLINQPMSPGRHSVILNAEGLASGLYYYKLKAGENVITKKMTLLK